MGASDALVQDSFSVLLSNHLICCARRVIIAGLEPANLTKNTKKTKNASLFNDFIGYYDFMFFWFYDRPMASWFLLVIASSMGRRWMNTLQILRAQLPPHLHCHLEPVHGAQVCEAVRLLAMDVLFSQSGPGRSFVCWGMLLNPIRHQILSWWIKTYEIYWHIMV